MRQLELPDFGDILGIALSKLGLRPEANETEITTATQQIDKEHFSALLDDYESLETFYYSHQNAIGEGFVSFSKKHQSHLMRTPN